MVSILNYIRKINLLLFLPIMNSKKHYILIDCDPGGDDIFALLWLLINHKFAYVPMEVIGITTV